MSATVTTGPRRSYLVPAGDRWQALSWSGMGWDAGPTSCVMTQPDSRAWLTFTPEPGMDGVCRVRNVWVEDSLEAWRDLFRSWPSRTMISPGVLACGLGRELIRCKVDAFGLMSRVSEGELIAMAEAGVAPHPDGRQSMVLALEASPEARGAVGWPGETRIPSEEQARALVRAMVAEAMPPRLSGVGVAYQWSSATGVPGDARGPFGWSAPVVTVAVVWSELVYEASLLEWVRQCMPRTDPERLDSWHPVRLAPGDVARAGPSRCGVLPGPVAASRDLVPGYQWRTRGRKQRPISRPRGAYQHDPACRVWRWVPNKAPR